MSVRLLMLGAVNHPHVEHLALAMHEREFEVVVAGNLEPTLPPSVLADEGVRVIPAPPMRRGSPRGAVAHVRWTKRLSRELRPDVVHAHWLCGFGAFASLARVHPLVVMAWGTDVFGAGPVKTLANRIALRGAEVAMADSQALLDRLVELGARREDCVLVNWGVDLDRFAPTEEPRADVKARLGLGDGPLILSPRSLMPVYNPATIAAAFALVADALPDAQLVMKHMAIEPPELELDERVHVVGHIPHDRMADYFRAADVCVSIPSSDSSPRSVWEAMACGTPVVLSDLPWVHELIEPGRDALVVPIDAEAVADALRRVLREAELARGLASRGRALAEAHRDRRVEMDRLADVYRRLA